MCYSVLPISFLMYCSRLMSTGNNKDLLTYLLTRCDSFCLLICLLANSSAALQRPSSAGAGAAAAQVSNCDMSHASCLLIVLYDDNYGVISIICVYYFVNIKFSYCTKMYKNCTILYVIQERYYA